MIIHRHRLALLLLPLLTGAVLTACGEKAEGNEGAETGMAATAGGETGEAAEAAEAGEENEASESSENLAAEAKVAEADARVTALAAVPGGTVKDFELEREGGALIYSYDISVVGKSGIDEVHIDAMTGKLLSTDHETPADEADEAAEDSAGTR